MTKELSTRAIGKAARGPRDRERVRKAERRSALLKQINPTQKAHKIGTVKKSPASRGDGKDNLEPEIFRFSQGPGVGRLEFLCVQVPNSGAVHSGAVRYIVLGLVGYSAVGSSCQVGALSESGASRQEHQQLLV